MPRLVRLRQRLLPLRPGRQLRILLPSPPLRRPSRRAARACSQRGRATLAPCSRRPHRRRAVRWRVAPKSLPAAAGDPAIDHSTAVFFVAGGELLASRNRTEVASLVQRLQRACYKGLGGMASLGWRNKASGGAVGRAWTSGRAWLARSNGPAWVSRSGCRRPHCLHVNLVIFFSAVTWKACGKDQEGTKTAKMTKKKTVSIHLRSGDSMVGGTASSTCAHLAGGALHYEKHHCNRICRFNCMHSSAAVVLCLGLFFEFLEQLIIMRNNLATWHRLQRCIYTHYCILTPYFSRHYLAT